MMTLSKALAAGQAKDYFQAEYTNTQESYYSEGETVKGKWFGKQADAWNLHGDVEQDHFDLLCEGQHPRTGDQLVRHVTRQKYENRYGETAETSEHRAGWDATFSAPKSVSLAALVGGDERILEAHDRSVDIALNELEKYIQARMGGNNPAQTTAKMVAAKFQHDSARPERNTGYAAPQLHTHTVIFNLTETGDGRIKPIQPLELYRSQRYATEIYRSVLATELHKLGYNIAVDPRTGAPEISDFSKEYLVASSPRRKEIQREASEMKARLAQQGIQVEDGAGLRQAAAKTDRMSKQYDRQEMRSRHLEMDNTFGGQAFRIAQEAQQCDVVMLTDEQVKTRARESITFARDNAAEREAVVDKRKVLIDALRRNVGLTTYEAVVDEFGKNITNGNFILITKNPGIDEVTTSQTVAMEQSNIRTVTAGEETKTAFVESEELDSMLRSIAQRQGLILNERQQEAVETILGSADRIIGLEGLAGTGKTTTLSVLREAVERCGYVVQGFAPTGVAADLLAESGISTSTLQQFVASPEMNSATGEKILYVMDESSLSDTRNMFRFFEKAGPSARVLLVGDSGQHQAVEAGAPFEQFVKAGMRTASLDEIVRQRSDLRKPVEQLAKRDVIGAVKTLFEQGRVTEVVDDEDRLRAIARDYVSNPKRTIVISPANQERVAINSIIHYELQQQGIVSAAQQETKILVLRQDMTGAERKFALAYVPHEDIIHYNKGSKALGINKGDYGRVLKTSHSDNEITIQLLDGREITYNPKRLSGVSVYKEAQRQFSVGDRVQFRAPFPEAKVKNTELGTIVKIDQGEFSISLNAGRVVTLNIDRFPHLDHGYAVTSYSAQGKTMDRVLVNAETTETDLLVNQRMAYVAVSRARFDARIYTDSAADLSRALARRKDKTVALEAVEQSHLGARLGQGTTNEFVPPQLKRTDPVLGSDVVNERDDYSVGRLKGLSIVVDSNAAVAQKRFDKFEKSKHLYSFDIDGEQWSLVSLDRQQRIQRRRIDDCRRVVSAYRKRLYGVINNPLKLYGLREYKQNAAKAKHQIYETQQRVDHFQEMRNAVTSHLQSQSEMLRVDLSKRTESAQELKYTLERRVDLHPNLEKQIPQPEFTEDELDRLEANARFLRDPKMLQTAYCHFEQHYRQTHQAIDKIAARADKTLEFANASLANIDDQIENFTDNRESFPVSFKTANGKKQSMTLRDLATKPADESIVARIFSAARSDRATIDEALNQHYADLRNERDAIQSFIKATSDLTESYREHLGTLNQVQAQTSLAGNEVTASESLALKSPFDNVGPNPTTSASFNTDITTSTHPTQSGEVKEMTAATPQPNADEHLKQIRQAIDNISSANAAMNETGIEAGMAEVEATASESLAALL
jgi:conjugative relaxase-like TrwC/TraI family protein